MDSEHDQKYIHIKKITLLVVVLILGAGFVGWRLGQSGSPPDTHPNGSTQFSDAPADKLPGVKSLVNYALPDGWKEASCPASAGSVYVTPSGSVDCDANPSSPVKISVDTGNAKDCNDLQNNQDVKKHTCISLYINGHKSLKSSTEYLASSSYKKSTTINAYYLDTGKEVVKAEYIFNSDNQYQAAFDQLANSIKVKT